MYREALCFLCWLLLLGSSSAQEDQILALPGAVDDGEFGASLDFVGDLDGDGCDDLAVGAPESGPSGSPLDGRADVYSGRTGAVLLTWLGNAGDRLGTAVRAAGDVNNDGYVDVVVGAPYHDPPNAGGLFGQNAGAAYVFSGKDGATLHAFFGNLSSNKLFTDLLGRSVDGAGDVNQDGFADVIVGVPTNNHFLNLRPPAVKVLSGINGVSLFRKETVDPDDGFGLSVAGVGDTNGDGFPDFLAGTPWADDNSPATTGGAWLYSGKTGQPLLHLTGGPNVGGASSFGYSIDAIGDADGNGLPDLLISSYTHGFVEVLSGLTGASLVKISEPGGPINFGFGAAGAGDIDRDGTPDVIASSLFGLAGAYSGATGAPIVVHAKSSSEFGKAVAGGGDANADGVPDFAVGNPDLSTMPGQSDRGEVTLHSGTCGGFTVHGAPCPGSGGFAPTLVAGGCATPAGTVSLSISNALGGAPTLLAFGLQAVTVPIGGGCSLHVAPLLPWLPVLPLGGVGPGQGALTLAGALPAGSAGISFAMQAFPLDPGTPLGHSATNGVEIQID